jgi:hypothetical protein
MDDKPIGFGGFIHGSTKVQIRFNSYFSLSDGIVIKGSQTPHSTVLTLDHFVTILVKYVCWFSY